jgi:chemotaxis protein CheX
MNRDVTSQLDQAVDEVLAVMLALDCTPEPLATPRQPAAFTASVLFSGSLNGVCTLAVNKPSAAEITASLIGVPAAEILPDLCADTAAELCNMIAGTWKSAQTQINDNCQISCPTIGSGDPLAQSSFRETVGRLYRFSEGHHFALILSFD